MSGNGDRSDLQQFGQRLAEMAARTMTDEQYAAVFSPDGLARTRHWYCEDHWIVEYTTTRVRHGRMDGYFLVLVFKPKGRVRKRVWNRVRLDRCDTRREAKQRALKVYYEHSPEAAAKHGWNGEGYDRG